VNVSRCLSVALAAVVVIGCSSASPSQSPESELEEGSNSKIAHLFERLDTEGKADKQLAIDAFSYMFAPLPGANALEGDEPELYERKSGTFAYNWIAQHADELTDEQMAAVEAHLTPGPNDVVILSTDPEPSAIAVAGAADFPLVRSEEHNKYVRILKEAEQGFAQKLGENLRRPWMLTVREAKGGEALAGTRQLVMPAIGLFGTTVGCAFETYAEVKDLDETSLRTTLAHEMWHCYQGQLGGFKPYPQWLIEGQAEWAGEALMGPSSVGGGHYLDYLASPRKSLFERDYDATGFFWQLSEHGISPWTHAKAMWQAFTNTGVFEASGANKQEFLQDWAPQLLRDSAIGAELNWNTKGIFSVGGRARRTPITVAVAANTPVSAAAVTNTPYEVTAAAPVIRSTIGPGNGLIGAPGSGTVDARNALLCTNPEGCKCPPNYVWRGPLPVPMASKFYLGVTGGLDGANGTLEGFRIEDFCVKEEEEPDVPPLPGNEQPNPGNGSSSGSGVGKDPCASGCSSSTGEPHLTTVDDVGYDFQATGEYVLLRSADGTFELQSRQVPLRDSLAVTVNSALAMRVGEQRVAVYVATERDLPLEVRVDGEIVDASTPIDLSGGAGVATYEGGVQIDFADGSHLWALPTGHGCCINMLLAASDGLKAGGVGLLGDVAPGGAPLPALPDGTRLPRPADRHEKFLQVYEQLGPAWMVTAETSLFDYEPGESPATFVVPGFPTEAEYRTLEDLPPDVRAAGEAACADVTDEARVFECIFDVSLADFIQWAEGYVKLIELEEDGPIAIGAPPPQATQPPLPPPGDLPDGFTRVADGVTWIDESRLSDDGLLYVAVRDDADAKSVLAFDTASRGVIAHVEIEHYGPMAITSNSLWVGAAEGLDCLIKRLDMRTLDEQASITIPCDIFRSQFASLGDDIWYLDRTTADIDGNNGTLRRIDPATNQVGTAETDAVTLPFTNGYLLGGGDAIFWRADAVDPAGDHQLYRLQPGATELESLGQPEDGSIFPGGTGVWTESQGDLGINVVHRTSAAGPDAVIPVDGVPVGGDATSAYVAGYDFDGTPILLRYPADGGAPDVVATSVTLDTSQGSQTLDYVSDRPVMVTDDTVATLWLVPSPDDPDLYQLVLQATPLP